MISVQYLQSWVYLILRCLLMSDLADKRGLGSRQCGCKRRLRWWPTCQHSGHSKSIWGTDSGEEAEDGVQGHLGGAPIHRPCRRSHVDSYARWGSGSVLFFLWFLISHSCVVGFCLFVRFFLVFFKLFLCTLHLHRIPLNLLAWNKHQYWKKT